MKILRNNQGIALVTALMLTLISLSLTTLLLYIVTQNITLSAAQKRYKTTLEASYGAVEVVTKEVIPLLFMDYSSVGSYGIAKQGLTTKLSGISLSVSASDSCLIQKLKSPVSGWSNCSDLQKSSAMDSVKSGYDVTFNLKGTNDSQGYNVYSKIVDTMPGNTDPSGVSMLSAEDKAAGESLLSGAGVAYNPKGTGGVNVQHIPVRYRIEVQGERASGTSEKSHLSVLYAF